MTRTRLLLTVVFLLSGLAPMGLANPSAELSPDQLYEQVRILQIARTIQFTSEQTNQLMPTIDAVHDQRQQLLSTADALWTQHQPAIEKVLDHWIAGTQPPADSLSAAHQAAATLGEKEADLQQRIAAAAEQILNMLAPSQRSRVESLQEQQQRQQMVAELDGAESLAEYIARHLDAQRQLMPDEYELVRLIDAQRLAAKIIAPGRPDYQQAVQAVLTLTDTVYDWSQQEYNAQRPGLADQVAQFLNLPPASAAPPVSYEDLLLLVSSPYTPALLRQIAPAVSASTETSQESPPQLAGHPFHLAQEKSDILALLNYLQLTPNQLPPLIPLAQQAAAAVTTADQTVQTKVEGLQSTLTQARQLLITTGTLPPELTQLLTQLRLTHQEAEHQKRAQIVGVLDQVENVLLPGQNRLIDWRLPPDLAVTDPQQQAAQQRQLAAQMSRALRFLEQLRYRDPFIYLQVRMTEVEQFLSNYVNPNSPQFAERRSFVIDLLDRMKMVEEPKWPQAGPHFAAELLEGVGAFQPAGRPGRTARPLSWEDLYEAFSSLHTPELLQQMLRARTRASM